MPQRAQLQKRFEISSHPGARSTGGRRDDRRLPGLPALMERPSNLVLDQSLESLDPAGLPWVCLVRVLLEPDELQHELLRDGTEIARLKGEHLHSCLIWLQLGFRNWVIW